MGVVYKIENTKNGKIYVGSTNNYQKRKRRHKRELRKSNHHNKHLQRAWNKYGSESFEFSKMEIVEAEEDLLDREQHYLDKESPEYNIAKDAFAIMKGRCHTKATKKKMSEARSGKNHPNYGKHLSEKTRQRIGRAHKGKTMAEEVKQKIRKSTRGEESSRAKLTKKKVKVIKLLQKGNQFTHQQIAKMYGVSKHTIDSIGSGQRWGHVNV